ncbi:MAG: type II secretion system F family protein [Verrucomicrobia bacterium]|nr:type II secretion system F family protein [Verrucomicrobiota bacterium]MDA1085655.1 type II secretion system F family protein [Verrucomicrobiota bacterium]
MSVFKYRAKDDSGSVTDGTITSVSRYAALSNLRTRGLTVLDLDEADEASILSSTALPATKKRRSFFRPRVGLTELSMFCRQLSISVVSGVPLRDALESITEDIEHPTLRETLEDVIDQLHTGSSLSEAIARHRPVFGGLFVALIRAAEESGSMADTLENLSDSLERTERLARRIRSITAYPLFVIGAFGVITSIMTFWVLPMFEESFADLTNDQGQLPALTRVVFGLNRMVLSNIGLILALSVAVTVALILHGRTDKGKMAYDRLLLRLPFFGNCVRKIAIARICRNLAIMIQGGVPITLAVEIAADISGNRVLRASMERVRDRIIQGADFSSSLAREEDMPRLVVRMVAVGESSGRLPTVMDKVSDAYEDQVEGAIMTATSLFEPMIICVFGAVILVLVMAIYLPVFSMSGSMN